MDPEELKRLLRSSGLDLWGLIDTAIRVAAKEQVQQLRLRRDSIVERLYAPPSTDHCRNCVAENGQPRLASTSPPLKKIAASPPSPQIDDEEDADDDEDEKSRIFAIKEFLDDPDQSEDSLVRLLQNLADMDITFKALKETDIGRNVNGLRKHPSNEVRLLVKHLVRKWKDTVDEWVKSNSGGDAASPAIITDGESPQQNSIKNNQTGHQVHEFGHSPLTQNGFLSSEKNGREPVPEPRSKPVAPPRREAPVKPINNNQYSNTPSSAIPAKVKEQKDNLMDPERLASARKRLQENYQEAQNAKKQRTIQVMDINEIPKKPKNSMVRKGGFQAKHW